MSGLVADTVTVMYNVMNTKQKQKQKQKQTILCCVVVKEEGVSE